MLLKSALWYRQQRNFSVIPIKTDGSKKPEVEWAEWQKDLPSEEQIKEWWSKWPKANIGIITGKISGISVMDFDWYKLTPEEKTQYEKDFPKVFTPTAFSPRKGEHRYFEYNPILPTKNGVLKALDIKNDGGYVIAPPSENGNGKYQWYERAKISDTTLHLVPDSYLFALSFKSISNKINTSTIRGVGDSSLQSVTKRYMDFNEGTRDESFFHLASRLIHGKAPVEEIQQILSLINARCSNPPLPEKQLFEKIASAIKRAESHERNLSQEILEWVRYNSGTFSVTECEQALQIVTKEQKNNRRIIFHRLIEKGILVKDAIKASTYRAIDPTVDEIKWWESTATELSMRFFFDLQEYVKLYPKNIIVLAGSPNAGKTALMLNLAKRSLQENYKVTYLSSEMDATELKVRLELMDNPNFEEMKKVRFLMRNRDFPDVIDPDGVNIIDFFEITDRFYLIAEELKRIWNKLKTGVAFIALQKDPKKAEGRGGTFGLEIPRLYLTVDYDKVNSHALRIIKAKNWKGENPNGFIQYFKIHQGVNLYPKGVWGPEV